MPQLMRTPIHSKTCNNRTLGQFCQMLRGALMQEDISVSGNHHPPTKNRITILEWKHHQSTWKELLWHPEPRWPCSAGCQSSRPEIKNHAQSMWKLIWTNLGAHLLLSKLLDLLDSPGRLVLEADPVQPLVHVDRVLTSDDLHILIIDKFWSFHC